MKAIGRQALTLALFTTTLSGQDTSSTPAPPTFSTGTTAVVLDVVVRDKHGHMVRDLRASDFEIAEEGTRQQTESFQIVSRPGVRAPETSQPSAGGQPAAATTGTGTTATLPVTAPGPALVAFVFDHLTPEGSKLARRSALTYTRELHAPGDQVGVFVVDLALRMIEPFSSDPERIVKGVERATRQALGGVDEANQKRLRRERMERLAKAEAQLQNATQGQSDGQGTTRVGDLAVQISLERNALALESTSAAIEREQRSHAATRGLLAVVGRLAEVPGRKTLLLFSEGLPVTSGVEALYKSLVDLANRSNVSIYTLDASGLRVENPLSEVAQNLARTATLRDDSSMPIRNLALERPEDLLRLTPESTLGPLARDTGGFFVSGTNDATDQLREIAEDQRFHYLLSYSPSNTAYDGRFRRVAVKVRRSGLDVRARQGYLATKPQVAQPDEQLLALLASDSATQGFPLYARALSFPDAQPSTGLFAEVPAAAVGYARSWDGRSLGAVSVLVRVQDEHGRTVTQAFRYYRPEAPAIGLPSATSKLLLSHDVALPAGRYTLEAAARDGISHKTSVLREPFEIAPVGAAEVRLSSLVLADGVRDLGAAAAPGRGGPLAFGESLLQPRVGEPVRKSATQALGLYFLVYGAGLTPGPATLEVWRGEERIGSQTLTLEQPDPKGRVRQAATVPLAPLAPGRYELRASVGTGARPASSRTTFTLVD